jgi:hypothetical protein
MIGTKASGKSHYIAVLMHELFQGVGARFGAVVELLDDATRLRYETQLVPRLYDDGLQLEGSASAAVQTSSVRRPLGVRLSFPNGRRNDVVNAVFFDTAGEDLASASVLEREARYIGQCAALILLIDPLQIPHVRELVGTTVDLPDVVIDPENVLRNVTELVRRERGVTGPTKLRQPLAIAFSKLDSIRGLFDEGSPVLRDPVSSGAFDVAEARSIGALLRAQLLEWLGPEFDAYATANYETVNYFALSALGAQPRNGQLARDVTPHRVADPMLWILSQWAAIRAAA